MHDSDRRARRGARWGRVAAVALLVVGVVLSVLGTLAWTAAQTRSDDQDFRASAHAVAATLDTELRRDADLVATMGAVVRSEPEISNVAFRRWFAAMGATRLYPGSPGFGFLQRVPAASLPAFLARTAADVGLDGTPVGAYTVKPAGQRATYCLIRAAVWQADRIPGAQIQPGIDLCATPLRTALAAAADSGRTVTVRLDAALISQLATALSGTSGAAGQLVGSAAALEYRSFPPMLLMIAPLYDGDASPDVAPVTAGSPRGWTIGMFDGGEVLRTALAAQPGITVELRTAAPTGGSRSLVTVGSARGHRSLTVPLVDGLWTARITGGAAGGLWAGAQPWVLLGGGIALTALCAALVEVLARGRYRALRLVVERTSALAHSEARLRSLAAAYPVGILQTDPDGGYVYGNERLAEVLGRGGEELAGHGWLEAFEPADRAAVTATVNAAGGSAAFLQVRLAGRFERWVRLSSAALTERGTVTGHVCSVTDVTAEVAAREALSLEARHDLLTGLPNRKLFLERLAEALATTTPQGRPAVLFIDLDRFKQVNDSLGHAAGDDLLVAAAGRLAGCLRPGDVLARLGGDEFTVLMPHVADPAEVAPVVGRLQAAITQPFAIAGSTVSVGASVGMALAADGATDPETLVEDADMAMYRAKHTASGYEVFAPELRASSVARLAAEQELRQGLDAGELEVTFQPVVALATGAPVAALARMSWRHPERGVLAPEEFLPLAQGAGLAATIVEQLLRTTIAAAARWPAGAPAVAVELFGQLPTAPTLADDVFALLEEAGLTPSRLCVGIDEMHLADLDVMRTLRRLRLRGVRVSIHGLGTGLFTLRRAPVDLVAIPPPVVAGLTEAAADRTVVRRTVELAHDLGLSAVAAGVGDEEQVRLLDALGCDLAWGPLWPAEAGSVPVVPVPVPVLPAQAGAPAIESGAAPVPAHAG